MLPFKNTAENYFSRLSDMTKCIPLDSVEELARAMFGSISEKKSLFIFGNGGSAGNAAHMANDFLYGVSKEVGCGLNVHALTSNVSVLTCLANDEGYSSIFANQLAVHAKSGDIALALSGSGNSDNIVNGLRWCKDHSIRTFAILGYDGGVAKSIADCPIHIPVNDMQLSEDSQLIIGHMIMQWFYLNKAEFVRQFRKSN
ncbi:MAG: hypothetical protein CBC42_05235 [Betaproteobacteria bacterium TMED82]|nr:MAG: hypothetical protein CBC42_05235 [Betaproteobacteria bacterium TMED82]|tara:strand:+ start:108541 stop:109140 length:600 start_codon:yes stop_codon:yes gene_type:complete